MRLLLIEDDEKLTESICYMLRKKLNYSIDTANNGKTGLEKFYDNSYDIILTDWMLGDIEGITLCKEVRKVNTQVPIIMLTSKSSIEDKLQGFEFGVDDYITKPFLIDELIARIKAIVRRKYTVVNQAEIRIRDLYINIDKHEVKLLNQPIILTGKEFALLEFLALNKGKALSRDEILQHVWDENVDSLSNTVDVYIKFLRNKLQDSEQKYIKTVKGKGYILGD